MITIIVILIVTSISIYTAQNRFSVNNLSKMYNDIDLLSDKVSNYYLKYSALPVVRDGSGQEVVYQHTNLNFNKNANDNDTYYMIDLSALEGISLNYGQEGFQKPNESDDVYIINEASHIIYYVKGIEHQGTVYHTVPESAWGAKDTIPPAKPQIKIISGKLNQGGIYFTEVALEIVAGKDNWSGTAKTTYTINNEEETELTADNSIVKITKNGSYTITVKTTDTVGNTSENTLQLTIKMIEIGETVEYHLPYTDIWANTEYTANNGWRYLGLDKDNNLLIVSRGIPAKLFYHHRGQGNISWWGSEEEVESTKANERASYGMVNSFEKIPYMQIKVGEIPSYNALGGMIEGKGENGTLGNAFRESSKISNKILKVRSLTLQDLNRAINQINGNNNRTETSTSRGFKNLIDKATGLFNMDDLDEYTDVSEDWTYWLAYPTSNDSDIWQVRKTSDIIGGSLGSVCSSVRVVIVLSNEVQFIDDNNDGIWEISFQ